MSGEHTIAPSGRSSPCAPSCRHATCVALARPDVDALASRVRTALLVADPDPTNAIEALDALARIARGDR